MKRLFSALLVFCILAGFLTAAPITANAENQSAAELGKVNFWRLIIKEDIGVHFQMSFTDEVLADENAYVEIKIADQTRKIPVSSAHTGLLVNVAPAQMTDEIRICIVSGGDIRDEVGTYSVKAYADQILGGEYDNATKKMVKAMLIYGAMAQKLFGHRMDALANAGVDFALSAVPAAEETAVTVSGEGNGITFHGASVCYESRLTLRYYFRSDDISRYTFTANGKKLQPVAKEDLYYVEIPEILPQEMGDYFCVSAEDTQGEALKVTYSPMDYVVRMYHKEDAAEETKNLLQALYTYHLAAKFYAA